MALKRSFVPEDCDLGSWDALAPLFAALQSRPLESPNQIEAWLRDFDELAACIGEEGQTRYIEMSCDTENADKEQRHLDFIENIRPKISPRYHELQKKLFESPAFSELDPKQYEILSRNTRSSIELYREENIPLEVEISKHGQKYRKLYGGMTVSFDGVEHTLPELRKKFESNDRSLRERAWVALYERQAEERETTDTIFDELLTLRKQVAENAHCKTNDMRD